MSSQCAATVCIEAMAPLCLLRSWTVLLHDSPPTQAVFILRNQISRDAKCPNTGLPPPWVHGHALSLLLTGSFCLQANSLSHSTAADTWMPFHVCEAPGEPCMNGTISPGDGQSLCEE